MGTYNYTRMKNFDLFAYEVSQEDLSENEFLYWDFIENLKPIIDEINESLLFHEISLKDGYYEGIQLFVDCQHELDVYDDYDDDDCFYYFDLDRNAAYKQYPAEVAKINDTLKELARNYGLHQIGIRTAYKNYNIKVA